MGEDMEFFIFIGVLVGLVIFMLIYSLVWGIRQQKKVDNYPSEPTHKTRKTTATVIDQYCAVHTIGHKTPKTVTVFTVVFQSGDEIIKLNIPEEMYDGFEKGQTGLLTIVDDDLYSFALNEDPGML